MPRLGTFCLARVVKEGFAEHDDVAKIIQNSAVIIRGNTKWTILDGQSYLSKDQIPYFYGRVVKFKIEADLSIVNEEEKSEESKIEKNLITASSPFVFIPSQSGIAFLHVPGHIERFKFFKIFQDLYTATIDALLNSIQLQTISDMRGFYDKIKSLDKIVSISAKVYPPNPLFGILWKPLREFLLKRNSASLDLDEKGKSSGINSDLQQMVEAITENHIHDLINTGFTPSLPDASILMAADGYGHGTVWGSEGGRIVPVSTKDATRSFKIQPDSDADEIFNTAYPIFKKVENERHMEHPDE